MAKCPKCDSLLGSMKIKEANASAGMGSVTWKGVFYLCPYCQTVLGASIDPIALKNDIVNSVVKKLKAAN